MRKRQQSVHQQAGSRPHLPRRQCQAELQATVLSHREDFAGRLAALEVSGVAPIPSRPCDAGNSLPLRARQAAQRYPRLALCLEQAQGPAAFAFRSSQFARSLQKAICLLANLSTMPKYLAKLGAVLDKPRNSRSLEEEFEVGPGVASSETEHTEVLNGGGSGGRRAPATRWSCPGAAHSTHPSRTRWSDHCGARDESTGRPDDSPRGILELGRHAKEHLLQHCGHFRTLRRVIVMVAGALDEGRIGGFERQHAMLCQIYKILESGAKDNGHDLVWGWPLSDLSDARLDVHWSPAEHWQGNAQSQERALLRRRRQFAKADSRRGKADPSGETARTGRQGRKSQRRRGKLRPGRDLHEAGPARLCDRSQCFPRHQNGWPMFFCIAVLLFQGNGVHEICQRGDRHSSFPSQLWAASDPDASQPTPSRALQPPRSTSRDCRPHVVLSRTAQHWRSGPSDETALFTCVHAAQHLLCCRIGEPPGSAGFQW